MRCVRARLSFPLIYSRDSHPEMQTLVFGGGHPSVTGVLVVSFQPGDISGSDAHAVRRLCPSFSHVFSPPFSHWVTSFFLDVPPFSSTSQLEGTVASGCLVLSPPTFTLRMQTDPQIYGLLLLLAWVSLGC